MIIFIACGFCYFSGSQSVPSTGGARYTKAIGLGIGLGSKEPTSFRRAESPIYVLQLGGEGWIGPTALTNSRLLKPRPSAWAGITTHLRCWYSLKVYSSTANKALTINNYITETLHQRSYLQLPESPIRV